MTHAGVARLVALLGAALLAACGAASTGGAAPTVVDGSDQTAQAEVAAGDESAQGLVLDEGITTPQALRESMESRVTRPPLAQLPASAGPSAVPVGPTTRLLMPETRPAFLPGAGGAPYEVGSAVSSEPLGRELITTFAEVDAHGDARLRYVP